MPRINEKEKNLIFLEKSVDIISAVNNQKLSPYLDIFRHYPENILLQNLGILTGFFRINDLGEESAYIVNFLSSVLKKEYYANPKRQIESSFDSAIRKVNLALSEIAKQGNISWLGKIDGAVCVLEKNNLHFSVAGKAKVFLLRNQSLTEISKDMAQDEIEPNPLKTFVNVSSGRLEKEDKIIVCGEDVFDIFSQEEIKKGAKRFPREKFVQFLKTALFNKLDLVGTIVIDIFEKEEKAPAPIETALEVDNAFSRKAFERQQKIPETLKEVFSQPDENENIEYTDEKTGHIYIQEGEEEIKKASTFSTYWMLFGEKMSDFYLWAKTRMKRRTALMAKSISRATHNSITSLKSKLAERKRVRMENKEQLEREKEIEREKASLASAKAMANRETQILKTDKYEPPPMKEAEPELPAPPIYNEPFLARLAKRKEELEKQEKNALEVPLKENFSSFKKIIPDFGKIKELYRSLGKKQKVYASVIILLILIVPLAFLKIQGAMKAKPLPQQAEVQTPSGREILAGEKNIIFLNDPENLSPIQDSKKLLFLNEKVIAASNSQIVTLDSSGSAKEFSWPQNYGGIIDAASMQDLNLAVIYTDQNKVISFLSATSQFAENNIAIPGDAKITTIGTYLTYAYLLDAQNNQIYRYPRATGGFGDKTSWLKDNINLSSACCMAIDENVYLINNDSVIKLFKGTNQNLNLEQTTNPFTPDGIFTDSNTQNIYILDKTYGRIIKFGKDGVLVGQYFHENIKKSTGLVVDEKNSKAYITTSDGLLSFSLQ
jgi:hypothetical protein